MKKYKVGVVGGGGRVHAIIWKLLQSPHVTAVYCAPGNAGIAGEKLQNGDSVICFPAVIKADGLALGKGANICRNQNQCVSAIKRLMIDGALGPAGDSVVVQKLLTGTETSLHYLCDGAHALPFPSCRDHKSLKENGKGPMTGGMGTISPAPLVDENKFSVLGNGLDSVSVVPNSKVFHAGTAVRDGRIVTNGGRVLGVTAWDEDTERARKRVYELVSKIKFEDGEQFRRDIGGPPIKM